MRFTNEQLRQMSDAARCGAMRAIRAAKSGHAGIALGAADVMTAVYANHLEIARDRFVLSAGHGSALLYSVLKLRGYDLPPLESFRKLGGGLPGHPEYGIPGVEATTGPLGQGIANAVGLAFAEKIKSSNKLIPNPQSPIPKIYCLCGDGDLMEGVAQEAVAVAGRYKLNNLVLLWDDNGISIDGPALTDLNVPMRMRAAGWEVLKANGHKFSEVNAALDKAKKSSKPTFIQCRTTIGLGSGLAGKAVAHGLALNDGQLAELIGKFESGEGFLLWEKVAERRAQSAGKIEIEENLKLSDSNSTSLCDLRSATPSASTRELSGKYLETLLARMPTLIGGSADLSENTNTKVAGSRDITHGDFGGNFINFGVREHAMAAIMNGLCLGGLRPYGGTFLVFSDYMRGAMRMSALMGLPVVYVLTHDSIAVGEDGPTHQPIEQLAGLRLIPNMNVFRPCNAEEVKWAWDTALGETNRPSCIVLSRQKLNCPPSFWGLRTEGSGGGAGNIDCGAYVIKSAISNHKSAITLLATGSEVPLAIEVSEKLGSASVVSMPCVEKFRLQDREYKNKILRGRVVAIEAGATAGWYEFADAVVGIDKFGESGDTAELLRHFGFDAAAIAEEIKRDFKI